MIFERKFPRDLNQCYVNKRTHPIYRHPAKEFSFVFIAKNPLNSKGNQFKYKFDHFSVGKNILLHHPLLPLLLFVNALSYLDAPLSLMYVMYVLYHSYIFYLFHQLFSFN